MITQTHLTFFFFALSLTQFGIYRNSGFSNMVWPEETPNETTA